MKRMLSDVIEKATSNEVASGMQLLSVIINKEDSCAECIWESTSRHRLESFLSGLRIPSIHSISEVQLLYGLERIVKVTK